MDDEDNQGLEIIQIDQKIFSAKYSTKGEVFRFLATEAMIYLPSFDTVTIWHLKELASGTKKVSSDILDLIFLGF